MAWEYGFYGVTGAFISSHLLRVTRFWSWELQNYPLPKGPITFYSLAWCEQEAVLRAPSCWHTQMDRAWECKHSWGDRVGKGEQEIKLAHRALWV